MLFTFCKYLLLDFRLSSLRVFTRRAMVFLACREFLTITGLSESMAASVAKSSKNPTIPQNLSFPNQVHFYSCKRI